MEFILKKSDNKKHKFDVILPTGRKLSFGAKGYSDYTEHKDKERKKKYIARHKAREYWDDFATKGFWSKHILWNKPDLKKSIKNTEKKYKIKIKY
jgi:hypothetical protein